MSATILKTRRLAWKTTVCCLAWLVIGAVAWASPAELCDSAARRVADRVGVPADIMLAVTRAETGRTRHGRFAPWPWTVNVAGQGHWFATRAAAQAFVRSRTEAGARSIDIGCFQINTRWHGMNFPDHSAMFDPRRNAHYAARFLRRLHSETGNWDMAIGAYHSRTDEHARRYRARVSKIRAELPAGNAARRLASLPPWPLARLGGLVRAPGARVSGGNAPTGLHMRAGSPVDLSPRAALWE